MMRKYINWPILVIALVLYVVISLLLLIFVFNAPWSDLVNPHYSIAFITGLIVTIFMLVKQNLLPIKLIDYVIRSIVGLFVLIGLYLIFLAYNKAFWQNPPWEPSVFGAGVSVLALAIALFAIFWPRTATQSDHRVTDIGKSQDKPNGAEIYVKGQTKIEPSDLCVPIYLNQQIVFDSLAILENGFSQFSIIKTAAMEVETKNTSIGASVGESNIFAFLGVSFKGENDISTGAHKLTEISKEKVHTPTSLFAKLRVALNSNDLIRHVKLETDLDNLSTGQFIEFRAVLRKNPLVDAIEGFKGLIELAAIFTNDKKGMAALIPQIDAMLIALTQSDTIDIIGEMLDSRKMKVVLSTKLSYFNNRDASEIIDGEFSVIGKVIRIVLPNSGENINLFRKTTFGMLNRKTFEKLKDGFKGSEEAGFKFPNLVTEIDGPAIQIIPIAIFT
ncbi:MAG: DUF6414 family protein [Dehalococcoidia bacterium]